MVGSQIALELAKLRSRKTVSIKRDRDPPKRQPIVIGASILDFTAKITSPVIKVQ